MSSPKITLNHYSYKSQSFADHDTLMAASQIFLKAIVEKIENLIRVNVYIQMAPKFMVS